PSYEKYLMEIVEIFSRNEGNTRVYSQLGTYFLQAGQKEKALEFFESGVNRGDMDFDLLVKTLLLQVDFKKFEEAKQLSQKGLEEYPAQPILYLVNGTVMNQTQEYREAEEILRFGLDFLLDNPTMEADFYQQLIFSYNGLEEAAKASEYEKKLAQIKDTQENE